ncbi:Protein CBG26209 [Caenorhabditis briggsae]|uniref:Protein CBG26209 n=1 Tax=Caenorhabditis briggsae TaxID=6238 RepID=B6ILV4_CAEBR|nr:Protein CBG26209 [Caenorhabditis briggsae]CAS00884.1 Protein CBG26209 [Caenorhabditis briggsae]
MQKVCAVCDGQSSGGKSGGRRKTKGGGKRDHYKAQDQLYRLNGQKVAKSVEDLSQKVVDLEEKIIQLKNQAKTDNQHIINLKKQLNNDNNNAQNLKRRLVKADQDIKKLTDLVEISDNIREDFAIEISQLRQEDKRLKLKLENLKTDSKSEICALKEQLQNCESQIIQLQNNLSQFKVSFEEQGIESLFLQETIHEKDLLNEELSQAINKVVRENEELKLRIRGLEAEREYFRGHRTENR